MSEEEKIKEIKEKLIQPFYEFPNPTSIELKCNDIDLILDLIKEYQKIKMQLEVEKIDNKYNQQETHEETIPRYKIIEKINELEGQEDWYIEHKSLDDLYGRIDLLKELLEE